MRAALVLAWALAVGCGGAAPATGSAATEAAAPLGSAPVTAAVESEPRFSSAKPDRTPSSIAMLTRGNVLTRHEVDVLDLEEPEALDPASLRRAGWIHMQEKDQGYVVRFGSDLVAEVEVATEPPYRVYGGAKVPQTHLRPSPVPPPCVPRAVPSRIPVRWGGIEPADWSADALWFQELEGTFDTRRCRGVAAKGWRVRARAVAPGLLYGYRRPASGEIVFIAPPAEWLSATVANAEQLHPHNGTLSLVRLALSEGRAGSALFVLGPTGVDLFDRLRGSRADTFTASAKGFRAIGLRADVVWAQGDARPAALVVGTGLTALPPRARR